MSRTVIGDVIRREIGFRGVLLSDDLSMGALKGGLGERARAALAAGCDLALHSSGEFKEMEEIAAAVDAMSAEAAARLERAEAFRHAPEPVDTGALAAQLDDLMGKA
jgi:beta-N-acetylhexosaminidase